MLDMANEDAPPEAPSFLEEASRRLGQLPRWGLERAMETARRVADPNGTQGSSHTLTEHVQNLAASAMRRSTDAARISLSPQATAATVVEIRNKAEVYFFVRGNRHTLCIPATYPDPFPLSFYLERAYDRHDFPALFAVEGLGREFGRSQVRKDSSVTGLLHEDSHLPLPRKSVLMLHAGLGMSFAKQLLDDLPRQVSRAELEKAVDQFVQLCRNNARPGYQIATLEPLGLVTRTFHARLTRDVDEVLKARYPALRHLYWHGAGRAVYFLAQNALPCATWDSFLQCEQECVDDLSREELLAGQAWAFCMVNMRQPEVLLHLFVTPHAANHPLPTAFQRGIAAALVMRQETTPGTGMITRLLEFDSIPARSRQAWDHFVLGPARQALGELESASSAAQWMNEAFDFSETDSILRSTTTS
jgi:hypothetical protein